MSTTVQQIFTVAKNKMEEATSFIDKFNERSHFLLFNVQTSPELKDFRKEIQEQKISDMKSSHVKSSLEQSDRMLKECLSWLQMAVQKKQEIRFPLRSYSSDTMDRYQRNQLGELKTRRAEDLVKATSQDDQYKLIHELETALIMGDTDYFNSLVDALLREVTDFQTIDAENFDKKNLANLIERQNSIPKNQSEFINKVKQLYDRFASQSDLLTLDISVANLTIAKTDLSQFVYAVKRGSMIFYTRRKVEKMSQEFISKNTQFVNSSVEAWSNAR